MDVSAFGYVLYILAMYMCLNTRHNIAARNMLIINRVSVTIWPSLSRRFGSSETGVYFGPGRGGRNTDVPQVYPCHHDQHTDEKVHNK